MLEEDKKKVCRGAIKSLADEYLAFLSQPAIEVEGKRRIMFSEELVQETKRRIEAYKEIALEMTK